MHKLFCERRLSGATAIVSAFRTICTPNFRNNKFDRIKKLLIKSFNLFIIEF